jgi:heme oxygenase (biliverdin-IX-beta and delta-forming)
MISEHLKEKTKEAHQSLEAVVVRQIKSIRGKDEYIRLLEKFHGYHAPMERVFDNHLNDDLIPNYSTRRKADLILKDLAKLGIEITGISESPELPMIDSLGSAFGAFYVLEGSTQGGAIVAEMLVKYGGVAPDTTTFFNVYGSDKKEMWQSFKLAMDKFSDEPGFEEDAIRAANATFTRFREWMLK